MPVKMKAINDISRCQSMYRKKNIASEDLCSNHYAFVLAICHEPGCSQEELAQTLCLDKSTVARALAHLEKYGYITRISNEKDRRQYLVHPTEKMLNVCPRVQLVGKEWNNRLTENISPDELEIFNQVLSRIAENAKKIMDELEDK